MNSIDMISGSTAKTPTKRRRIYAGKTGGKLRLKTLQALDGRTYAAKRATELIRTMEQEISGGDVAVLTEGTKQLIQRAALLGALIENNETRWLAGDTIEFNTYFQAINSRRRILTTLGLHRSLRDVTPIDDLVAAIDRDKAAATTIEVEAAE
jgi:hypothetical protein